MQTHTFPEFCSQSSFTFLVTRKVWRYLKSYSMLVEKICTSRYLQSLFTCSFDFYWSWVLREIQVLPVPAVPRFLPVLLSHVYFSDPENPSAAASSFNFHPRQDPQWEKKRLSDSSVIPKVSWSASKTPGLMHLTFNSQLLCSAEGTSRPYIPTGEAGKILLAAVPRNFYLFCECLKFGGWWCTSLQTPKSRHDAAMMYSSTDRIPKSAQHCRRTVTPQQTNGPTHPTPCLTATSDGFFRLKYEKVIFFAQY